MNVQPGPDYLIDLDGVIRPKRSEVERQAEREIEYAEARRAINRAKARLLRQRRPWWLRWW